MNISGNYTSNNNTVSPPLIQSEKKKKTQGVGGNSGVGGSGGVGGAGSSGGATNPDKVKETKTSPAGSRFKASKMAMMLGILGGILLVAGSAALSALAGPIIITVGAGVLLVAVSLLGGPSGAKNEKTEEKKDKDNKDENITNNNTTNNDNSVKNEGDTINNTTINNNNPSDEVKEKLDSMQNTITDLNDLVQELVKKNESEKKRIDEDHSIKKENISNEVKNYFNTINIIVNGEGDAEGIKEKITKIFDNKDLDVNELKKIFTIFINMQNLQRQPEQVLLITNGTGQTIKEISDPRIEEISDSRIEEISNLENVEPEPEPEIEPEPEPEDNKKLNSTNIGKCNKLNVGIGQLMLLGQYMDKVEKLEDICKIPGLSGLKTGDDLLSNLANQKNPTAKEVITGLKNRFKESIEKNNKQLMDDIPVKMIKYSEDKFVMKNPQLKIKDKKEPFFLKIGGDKNGKGEKSIMVPNYMAFAAKIQHIKSEYVKAITDTDGGGPEKAANLLGQFGVLINTFYSECDILGNSKNLDENAKKVLNKIATLNQEIFADSGMNKSSVDRTGNHGNLYDGEGVSMEKALKEFNDVCFKGGVSKNKKVGDCILKRFGDQKKSINLKGSNPSSPRSKI